MNTRARNVGQMIAPPSISLYYPTFLIPRVTLQVEDSYMENSRSFATLMKTKTHEIKGGILKSLSVSAYDYSNAKVQICSFVKSQAGIQKSQQTPKNISPV